MRAAAQPDDMLLVDVRYGTRLRYHDLDRWATGVGGQLRGAGLPPGAVVAVPIDRDATGCAVVYVAALKAGLRPMAVPDAHTVADATAIAVPGGGGVLEGLTVLSPDCAPGHDGSGAGDAIFDNGRITLRSDAQLRNLAPANPKFLPMVKDLAYRLDPGTFGTMLTWHTWRGRCGYVVSGDLAALCEAVAQRHISAVLLSRALYEEVVGRESLPQDVSSVHELYLSFTTRVLKSQHDAIKTAFPNAASLPLPAADPRLQRLISRAEDAVTGPAASRRAATAAATALPTPCLAELMPGPAAAYLTLLIDVLTRSIFDYEFRPTSRPGLYRKEVIDRRARTLGRDWPHEAETMVGTHRLTHLAACVADLVNEDVPGDLVEAGAWRGGSCILMRGALKVLGEDARRVWVADSFNGFPPEDFTLATDGNPVETTSFQFPLISVGMDTVVRNFQRYRLYDQQVRLVPGWFHESLPELPVTSIALLRLDGDLFDSTIAPLEALYPRVEKGGFCIIDDYGDVRECREAVDRFRANHHISEPIEWIDTDAVFWRKARPR